jgi:hypothetical protein
MEGLCFEASLGKTQSQPIKMGKVLCASHLNYIESINRRLKVQADPNKET